MSVYSEWSVSFLSKAILVMTIHVGLGFSASVTASWQKKNNTQWNKTWWNTYKNSNLVYIQSHSPWKAHGFTQKETHLLSKCFLLNTESRLSLVVWVQSTIQTPCQRTCETAHVSNEMVNVHCLEAAWNCPLLTPDQTPPGKLIESAQPA